MAMDDRRQSGLWNRNPRTGFYEQIKPPSQAQPAGPNQYYQPPPPRTSQEKRRSFSERTAGILPDTNGGPRSNPMASSGDPPGQSTTVNQKFAQPVRDVLSNYPKTTSDQLAQTMHVNSTELPGSSHQPPVHIDPDHIPENIRATTWSPDPASKQVQAHSQPPQVSNASNVETVRRGSVPDRSPLQNLETWSKEEKRARVEQAENRARQRSVSDNGPTGLSRQGTLRSEKGRLVSDSATRNNPMDSVGDSARQSSGNVHGSRLSGSERFLKASQALKQETSPGDMQQPWSNQRRSGSVSGETGQGRVPPISNNPQPYHHAPLTPRDLHTADWSSQNEYKAPRTSVDIRNNPRPYHHAPPAPRNLRTADWTPQATSLPSNRSAALNRSESAKYPSRTETAGLAGAAAAVSAGAGVAAYDGAAERGKAAYERRRSQTNSAGVDNKTGFDTSNANTPRLSNQPRGPDDWSKSQPTREQMEMDRTFNSGGSQPGIPPPVTSTRGPTQSHPLDPEWYAIPPQTATGQRKAGPDGYNSGAGAVQTEPKEKQIRFHSTPQGVKGDYRAFNQPLEEWRQAETARLTTGDLDFGRPVMAPPAQEDQGLTWWEKGRRASSSGSRQIQDPAQLDGPYEEQASGFQPRLFLKCGPLLRYTGMRKEAMSSNSGGPGNSSVNKEIWRGSVMIVTEDDQSDLSASPILRLFAQPMELHPPASSHLKGSEHDVSFDHDDPVEGQVKLSRTGRPLYVRPAHDIKAGTDLSRVENPNGLYSAQRTPTLGPQNMVGPDGIQSQHITYQPKSRVQKRDGERVERYRDVKAIRLHTERGCTFWRFNIEVELGTKQHRVAYRINKGPAIGFWVPASGETMNIMFHSCNGFSLSVDSNLFCGPDPMWRNALNLHQSRPFHAMIGGGDQIYNDAVTRETKLFREWLQEKNPAHKNGTDFTPDLQEELETFYFNRYAMWFSQGLFSMANSQIPMVNIWDDHDIIDGFGSYPHHFMNSQVFCGLGAVAFKYYMLFQHQSLVAETEKEEPSWLLGKTRGPYIHEVSRSVFLNLGRHVAFLGLDCRTERMRDEILTQETYDLVFDRCHDEITKNETKHLIVLLGVPIAYPRLNFLENILTSRVMDPIKAIGRTGMLGGFINKFDGGAEILDDLDDHWTAKHHKAERNWFIQELQELASEKSVRITILGGDVHLGAVGQFYSAKKLGISKDQDHRYMPNIISSAIVNTPPPPMMADVLNRRNKIHNLDEDTCEDMIPMFEHDVDGSKRNNRGLLPRRNFCTIREYHPGSTRPSTPVEHQLVDRGAAASYGEEQNGRQYPPPSLGRTRSLTRGPANLIRRLSGSRKRNPPVSLDTAEPPRRYSFDQPSMQQSMQRANTIGGSQPDMSSRARPTFHRRPTNLSVKEARKAAAKGGGEDGIDGRPAGHIDLEGGLDISLHMEIDQHDPVGATVPYRILVPALWYDGPEDLNTNRFKSRRASLMDRLRGNRKREMPAGDEHDDFYDSNDGVYSPELPPESEHDAEAGDGGQPPLAQPTFTQPPLAQQPRAQPPSTQQPRAHPPPATGLGLSTTSQGATNDEYQQRNRGASDGRAGEPLHTPHAAYQQGYNLSSPPIGSAQIPPQRQMSQNTRRDPPGRPSQDGAAHWNSYPQSGAPRPNAPLSSNPPSGFDTWNSQGRDRGDNMSPSSPEDDWFLHEGHVQQPPRRGSKADKFFGVGDGATPEGLWGGGDDGGRTSMQLERDALGRTGQLGRESSTKKRPWQIWK